MRKLVYCKVLWRFSSLSWCCISCYECINVCGTWGFHESTMYVCRLWSDSKPSTANMTAISRHCLTFVRPTNFLSDPLAKGSDKDIIPIYTSWLYHVWRRGGGVLCGQIVCLYAKCVYVHAPVLVVTPINYLEKLYKRMICDVLEDCTTIQSVGGSKQTWQRRCWSNMYR